jgi:hypothetical protein
MASARPPVEPIDPGGVVAVLATMALACLRGE